MKILISLSPYIIFSVVYHMAGALPALIIGFLLSLAFLIYYRVIDTKLRFIELTSVFIFGLLIVFIYKTE